MSRRSCAGARLLARLTIAERTGGLCEQLGGVRLRLAGRVTTEHARELVLACCGRQLAHVRLGPPADLGLLDVKVMIGERGDLRQVRDAQDLTAAVERGDRADLRADDLRGRATDAGVDLVEDVRRDLVGAPQRARSSARSAPIPRSSRSAASSSRSRP
jgi:hypothetical protein